MNNKEENKKNNSQNKNQDIKHSKTDILNTKKEFNIFSLINMNLKKQKISTFIILISLLNIIFLVLIIFWIYNSNLKQDQLLAKLSNQIEMMPTPISQGRLGLIIKKNNDDLMLEINKEIFSLNNKIKEIENLINSYPKPISEGKIGLIIDKKIQKINSEFENKIQKNLSSDKGSSLISKQNQEIINEIKIELKNLQLSLENFSKVIGSEKTDKSLTQEIIELKSQKNTDETKISSLSNSEVNQFDNINTYAVTYGETDFSQYAMADAIVGKNNIQGKLPITIPNTEFKFGDGIQLASLGVFEDYYADSLYDFSKVDKLMEEAVNDKIFPGAVLAVGHRGKLVYHKPFGKFTYDKDARGVDKKSIFDLASVSKVVGTTSAAMLLYDEGLLDLDKKVIEYLPEFNNNGKDKITVRNLLLHNSGLIAFVEYYRKLSTKEEVINAIMNSELKYPTGTDYVYSDLGMITLQQIIEKLAGKGLDEFLEERIFKPMGMNRTMYNPSEEFWYDVLPTEVDDYWRMTTVKAKVHDENAYMLGGVAGHAGLFSTAEDLSKFMQMMLNKGVYKGKRYFKESTVETWTTKQTDQSTRGLGWDTKSEENSSFGTLFSMNSFGHTGFTGTSVWADKDNGVYVVLLTNRVYPTRDNREIVRFRPKVTDAIAEAVLYETE